MCADKRKVVFKSCLGCFQAVCPYRGGRFLVLGRANPRTGENEPPYWAANPLHGSQKSPCWVSKIRSMGLTIPLHGSQKSPCWVSKIRSTGLKILLHGSQKSPAPGKPRAVYDPSSLLDAFTLSFIGFLLCLSSLFVPYVPMCRVLFHILRVSGYE